MIWDAEIVLEDGSRYPGRRFGALHDVAGEVVFATGMVGYTDSLTDPSYRGQILVLTYPLQGNYGVGTPDGPGFESSRIQAQALVVGAAARHPSHFTSTRSLADWLRSEEIPGVEDVDTRALTRHLRERGTMRGAIVPRGLAGRALDDAMLRARAVSPGDVARIVAPVEPRLHPGGDARVLLVDSGAKRGIVRELVRRGLSVVAVPFHDDLREAAAHHAVNGLVLGNGPGDPKALGEYVAQVRELVEGELPLLGICLGHQILALAAGLDTYRLPYGHRSQNQPVRDLLTGRCYVTSQNHGYAVRADAPPPGWRAWFVNLNDHTNEGLVHEHRPVRSVQFHPEAAPGPEDTGFVFDDFAADVRSQLGAGSGS